MKQNLDWLPHMIDIPLEAKRNRTSLYTIALEGWRRGLQLKFHQVKKDEQLKLLYSLTNDKQTHYFEESCGDGVTDEAKEICEDKYATQEYLIKAGVPIPQGRKFTKGDSLENIVQYTKELTYPLVVKPTDGSGGKGVTTNIQSEDVLIQEINTLREKFDYKNILVQEHVQGDEVRVYVLEDQVLAAAGRMPANVVGDGKHTIKELIRLKNETRKYVPHLYFRPIRVDKAMHERMREFGYTADYILPEVEKLYLKTISNVSAGGEPINSTETLTDEQKQIAVAAAKAIPGLAHSGVDLIIDNETGTCKVLEVNTRPGIGSHLFPIEGQAIDIPKKIIDFYFPETKDQRNLTQTSQYYFNLQSVFDAFDGGYIEEIVITPCPQTVYIAKRVKLNIEMDLHHFYHKIKKIVMQNQIHSQMKKDVNNEVTIILAHEKESVLNELIKYISDRKKAFLIKHIEIDRYQGSIKIGNEIIDSLGKKSILELEIFSKETQKKIAIIDKEIVRINKRIKKIISSTSWKMTKIIRNIKK